MLCAARVLGDIMTLVYKIAAVALAVAVINQVLQKSGREEYTTFITLAGVLCVVLMLLPELSSLKDALDAFFEL